jgi:hypothetical protein
VARPREHLGNRSFFDDLARIHHANPLRNLGNDCEVVGDEHQTHALASALERGEQIEDLRLDCDVERRGGLVGNEQARPIRDRHRHHGALKLTARELMWEGMCTPFRVWQPNFPQQSDGLNRHG